MQKLWFAAADVASTGGRACAARSRRRCPAVSTTLGDEGLGAAPGDHLLVADDAVGFARAVTRFRDEPRAPATRRSRHGSGGAPAIGAGAAWLALPRLGWHARRLCASLARAGNSPLESLHVFC